MTEPITTQDILKLVRRLVSFPRSQICVHSVAADLLSLLIRKGWDCPEALAAAVVEARDCEALQLLDELEK